ncbi:hypothetical protein LshimejAT787_1300290 [Lyophyllum shimeji]|uniref:Uncharacterized protein n=1 Tax=Lyophyllum shimeji TaxID=47721 RepID=A0A9P3PWZ3_LYOSH|nr:hypothetical protein LshimejAT787_1300290 [Lyophyllum shimeji]
MFVSSNVYTIRSLNANKPPSETNSVASENLPPRRTRIPKWEKRLPSEYRICSTSSDSLKVKVEIQTTDTGDVHSVNALVDSGASGLFLDRSFVAKHHLTTRSLANPILVRNVDGTPNEDGRIREVVDVILRHQGHTE